MQVRSFLKQSCVRSFLITFSVISLHICDGSDLDTVHNMNFLHWLINGNSSPAAILMDLSKAFVTVIHALLLPKMHAYGFDSLLFSFWNHISQTVCRELRSMNFVAHGVSWCLVSVKVLCLDIYCLTYKLTICYVFDGCEVSRYADYTTLRASGESLQSVLQALEFQSTVVLDWFSAYFMKPNEDKCHLLCGWEENRS